MDLHGKRIDRENLNSRPTKPILPSKTLPNTRRPALGEVGNKIHINTEQNEVKVKALKAPQVEARKKQLKKAASTASTTIDQNTKKCVKTNTLDKDDLKEKCKEMKSTSSSLLPIKENLSYSTKQLLEIVDIDTTGNPLHVSEYVQDIYTYLLELENECSINEHFLENHKSTPRMRAVLVNWMVEIHTNFKFYLETLHLAVAILDRYLQLNKDVGRSSLQLVGTVAMFVAGKYEEMYLPSISDFIYICDNTFSQKQLLQMEIDILKQLDFNLGRPLSLQFLRRFNKIAIVKSHHHNLGKYILELALIDYELCQIKPSKLAAAACCLSLGLLGDMNSASKGWTNILVHHTTYTYADLKPVLLLMACALNKAETSKHQSIRTKYAASTYSKISAHPKLTGPLMKILLVQAANCSKK